MLQLQSTPPYDSSETLENIDGPNMQEQFRISYKKSEHHGFIDVYDSYRGERELYLLWEDHTRDEHCCLNADEVCMVCGVDHSGDPCPVCHTKAYHLEGCVKIGGKCMSYKE